MPLYPPPSSGSGATTALDNLASVAINTSLLSDTDNTDALGSAAKNWSDLFLGDGALINFNNGNAVVTHSSGILTVSTGDLRVTTAGTNTASAVTVGGTQTLTSKTLTSPAISAPTITGVCDIQQSARLSGDISPAEITGDQNDYDPTGLSTASVLRLTSDAARNITSLAGGADGRLILIHNVGSNNIVLKKDDLASGTEANRFDFAADITLASKQSAAIQYDSTSSRWRCVSYPVTAGSGLSSLNGETGGTQTFADADDTNVTLAISSITDTHTFTMGWSGQLSLARGGTGANLADPGADRMAFWDDSEGTVAWLAAGNSVAITTTTLDTIQDIRTSASPQFTGIELGHASDTTLARSAAGTVTIEGNVIYRAGGTDVPVADGGTGASTAAAARVALGIITLARFGPAANQPPSSNYATFDLRNGQLCLDFDGSTDEEAIFCGTMAEEYAGGDVIVELHVRFTSATTGTANIEVSWERRNTDADSDSFATMIDGSATPNGTSGIETVVAITFTSSQIDGVTAGDAFRLKVRRDADGTNGTDDITTDMELYEIHIYGA